MINDTEYILQIRDTVSLINKFKQIPEISNLKTIDFVSYNNKLKSIFPIFSTNYESLFELIINDYDLSPLELMLDNYNKISNGLIEKETAEKEIGEKLAEKFVSPK
jgi:hypothetical protein